MSGRELIDPVPSDLLIGPDDVKGWSPDVFAEQLGDADRIEAGVVSPVEVALQSMFGIYVFSDFHPKRDLEVSHYRRFEMQRERVINVFKGDGPGSHEGAFLCAIALWQDREQLVDLGANYSTFSAATDGHFRTAGVL